MAVILFYGPFNQRSRDTESLMIAFQQQGHRVMCLTQQEGFQINDFLKSKGIPAFAHVVSGTRTGWWYYLRQLIFFVRFCKREKVEIVYSHLEPANFVSAIGQFLIKARTYICRHHIDEGRLYRFDRDIYYRLTYWLAKKIIVVSRNAALYMTEREGIPARKIIHINLAYDFGLYPKPDHHKTLGIKQSDVLLLTMCRLTTFKRPDRSIDLTRKLQDHGIDAKLIILGKGEMERELLQRIHDLGLDDRVLLPGYVDNVMDYLEASDFLVHPSLLESSCVAVKEAGLASKPVIVCRGVGDFDDYVDSGRNGWAVNRDNFVEEAADIIFKYHQDKATLLHVGKQLHQSVINLFSIEKVVSQYDGLNQP